LLFLPCTLLESKAGVPPFVRGTSFLGGCLHQVPSVSPFRASFFHWLPSCAPSYIWALRVESVLRLPFSFFFFLRQRPLWVHVSFPPGTRYKPSRQECFAAPLLPGNPPPGRTVLFFLFLCAAVSCFFFRWALLTPRNLCHPPPPLFLFPFPRF